MLAQFFQRLGRHRKSTTTLSRFSEEIAALIEGVSPSVVQLSGDASTSRSVLNPLRYVWSETKDDLRQSGAGVIIQRDGLIVTNNHVIEGMQAIVVQLQDGRRFTPEIVGIDPFLDLAVLRIPAHDLVPVKVDPSRHVRIGELVFAIGNPLEYAGSVTMGVVSSNERLLQNGPRPFTFFQTDAAINRGNSGGALVGCDGLLVGIPTFVEVEAQNIGFAIPAKSMMKSVEKLLKDGRVSYGTIGISGEMFDLPADAVRKHGLRETVALWLQEVDPVLSAGRAGLEPGDLILSVDLDLITSVEGFFDIISEKAIMQEIRVLVLKSDLSFCEKRVKVTKLQVEDNA